MGGEECGGAESEWVEPAPPLRYTARLFGPASGEIFSLPGGRFGSEHGGAGPEIGWPRIGWLVFQLWRMRVVPSVVWAKCGVGQVWCGQSVVWAAMLPALCAGRSLPAI